MSSARQGVWRRVASMFRPYRGLVALSLFLVVCSVALNAVGPLLLQRVLDVAFPRHDTRLLGRLCGTMIVVGVLASAVSVGQTALTNLAGQKVVHDLRVAVYDRVRRMPLGFFSRNANTEIQARLVSDIGGINEVVTFTAQSLLTSAVGLVTAAVVMAVLSWPLALVSLALATLLSGVNHLFTKRRLDLARTGQEQVAEMLRLVGEDLTLPGVILGRTLGRHGWQRARFVTASERIADRMYRQRLAGSTGRALIALTLACLPPAVYWLAGTVVPGLTLGTVVVISTLQVRLSTPIQLLLGHGSTVQTSTAMFERIFDYLDLPATVDLHDGRRARTAVAAPSSLRVVGVSHVYDSGDRRALDGVDLDVEAGSVTLITGHSGSGKSTLAMVLAGLLVPTGGTVELVDAGPVTDARLRDLVTLVPQESVLFNASLRENLLFARPDATVGELSGAIAAAQLDGLITRLPESLDTMVGERGYELSGGERQRVALARALLTYDPLLVLDEATSALDMPTAERVHQRVIEYWRGRGLVIVAHRIPTLRPCDRVIVLDHGRVIERGTHHDLIAADGPYARLLAMQATSGRPAGSRR